MEKREGKALALPGLVQGHPPAACPEQWRCPRAGPAGAGWGRSVGEAAGWWKINHSALVLSLSAPTGFDKQNFTVH